MRHRCGDQDSYLTWLGSWLSDVKSQRSMGEKSQGEKSEVFTQANLISQGEFSRV